MMNRTRRSAVVSDPARLRYLPAALIILFMLLAATNCGSRLRIWWEARATSAITISGRIVTSERLGIDNQWGAKAVPVNAVPPFRPWLPEDLREQARCVIGVEPGQIVTRGGRTLYAYAFVLKVPREVRIVEIRERRSLLRRSASTTSQLWKPGGYRIKISSLPGWEWTSKEVYSSNISGIELFVKPPTRGG
jgi:hypothetical protein